jgi:hypothetical protein
MTAAPTGTPKKRPLADTVASTEALAHPALDASSDAMGMFFANSRKYFPSGPTTIRDSDSNRFQRHWGDGPGSGGEGDACESPKRMCLAPPSPPSAALAAVSLWPGAPDRPEPPAALSAAAPAHAAPAPGRRTAAELPGRREVGVKRACPRDSPSEEDSGEVDISLQPLALVERHDSRGSGIISEQGLLTSGNAPHSSFPRSSVSSVDAAIESIIRKHRRTVLEPPRGGGQCVQLQLIPLGPDPLLDLRYLGLGAAAGKDEAPLVHLPPDTSSPTLGSRESSPAAHFSEGASSAPPRASHRDAQSTSRNELFYSGDVSHAGWVLDIVEDGAERQPGGEGGMELCDA